MKINKHRPFAYIYFFINGVGLPFGLLFTTVLSPLFYLWLLINRKKNIITRFLLFMVPFAIIHINNGVKLNFYITSTILLFTNYIYVITLKTYLEKTVKLEELFNRLTVINFVLTIVALFFKNSPYVYTFWTVSRITYNVDETQRLSMFTYEPSYYSTLLVPLVFFYVASLIHKPLRKHLIYLTFLAFSLILSYSLGIIACLFISVALLFLIRFRHYFLKRNFIRIASILLVAGIGATVIALIFYPKNSLFVRIENIIEGKDSSGNGRTYEAFMLSYEIAKERSLAFGVGPGQIKVIGDPIIRNYYGYSREDYPVVTIPCAAAETIAIFGFVGLAIRLFLQFYFFFKTKTYKSNFRLMLFLFIFIYQFTGSYITNIAEYTIWVLAFVPCLYQFERQKEALPEPATT